MILQELEENYKTGYIKMYRSLKNKGWYKKSEYLHLWIHILLKATHSKFEIFINGKTKILNSGQFITGRKKLSEETGINESKIERILTFFEKNEHQIEQQKSNKNRIITVLSWDNYQYNEQQTEQQLNNKRTTTEQQLNTNKNYKNYKNEKKKNIYIDFIESFNSITGKKIRVPDKKFKGQLNARLSEGFTVDEILKAVENCKQDKYHMENPKYLTPEFITRADKLQKFLNTEIKKRVLLTDEHIK